MKAVFKKARRKDLSKIVAIYNETIASRMVTADLEAVSVASRQAWFEAHGEKMPLWLIIADTKVVGWVGLDAFYGRKAYQRTAEISIYIDADYHYKGLGQQAIDFVIEQLKTLQIDTLLAFIFGHNQPSLNLFAKNGFEHWGHLPKVALMDDKRRDLEIMGRNFLKI
ncbi:MAG TPA: GNAT family N-acetyltransferase [Tetragenococcus sp.]|nr:GNAT family N-acetyltransferase [Tetragenococcus sp.]